MIEDSLPEVDAHTALQLVDQGAVLLDVREDDEWSAGHSPAAIHVPLSALSSAEIPGVADRRIVVVCRSGNRSKGATQFLLGRGADAVNLAGGMKAWMLAGGSVVTNSGSAGRSFKG
jgi:rhodanese-related sulfurtransferase